MYMVEISNFFLNEKNPQNLEGETDLFYIDELIKTFFCERITKSTHNKRTYNRERERKGRRQQQQHKHSHIQS